MSIPAYYSGIDIETQSIMLPVRYIAESEST